MKTYYRITEESRLNIETSTETYQIDFYDISDQLWQEIAEEAGFYSADDLEQFSHQSRAYDLDALFDEKLNEYNLRIDGQHFVYAGLCATESLEELACYDEASDWVEIHPNAVIEVFSGVALGRTRTDDGWVVKRNETLEILPVSTLEEIYA